MSGRSYVAVIPNAEGSWCTQHSSRGPLGARAWAGVGGAPCVVQSGCWFQSVSRAPPLARASAWDCVQRLCASSFPRWRGAIMWILVEASGRSLLPGSRQAHPRAVSWPGLWAEVCGELAVGAWE